MKLTRRSESRSRQIEQEIKQIKTTNKEFLTATAYLPNVDNAKFGPIIRCKRRKQTLAFKRAVPV